MCDYIGPVGGQRTFLSTRPTLSALPLRVREYRSGSAVANARTFAHTGSTLWNGNIAPVHIGAV